MNPNIPLILRLPEKFVPAAQFRTTVGTIFRISDHIVADKEGLKSFQFSFECRTPTHVTFSVMFVSQHPFLSYTSDGEMSATLIFTPIANIKNETIWRFFVDSLGEHFPMIKQSAELAQFEHRW